MKKVIKVLAIVGIAFVAISLVFTVLGIPVLNLIFIKIELYTGILIGVALMLVALTYKHILG